MLAGEYSPAMTAQRVTRVEFGRLTPALSQQR
jgi:hypothetical protein